MIVVIDDDSDDDSHQFKWRQPHISHPFLNDGIRAMMSMMSMMTMMMNDEDNDDDVVNDDDANDDDDATHQLLPEWRQAHVSDALPNDLPDRLQESISELRRAGTE